MYKCSPFTKKDKRLPRKRKKRKYLINKQDFFFPGINDIMFVFQLEIPKWAKILNLCDG